MIARLSLLALCLALAPDAEKSGSISGSVKFDGKPPRPRYDRMGDQACAAMHPGKVKNEALLVDGKKGVKWAFVYVKDGVPQRAYPVPKKPVLLDQKGCVYHPRVFGVHAGQEILIRNSDDVCHNVHAQPFENRGFNFAQPQKGMTAIRSFPLKEQMIKIKCDIHPWMSAWAGVMDHPFFAVTDASGKFELRGLPPGAYTLGVWQEKCAPATMKVKVEAGKATTANFEIRAK